MMPSVIPARLQFQCGHAALVTLPRVKGETGTQRNNRVAREKEAALGRQCDFCAPVNGTVYVEVADALEKATPVEELAVLVAAAPEPSAEGLEAVALADDSAAAADVLEVLAAAAELEAVAEEPQAVLAEPETASELVAVEIDVVEAAPVEAVNGTNGTAAAKSTRKPRARRQPSEMLARGRRFLVEYRLERVLRADSIHDALRQVATYGSGEVVAITRED